MVKLLFTEAHKRFFRYAIQNFLVFATATFI